MRRTYESGAKARLSYCGGPHASVNLADSLEEMNVDEKEKNNNNNNNAENSTFAALYCAIFRTPSLRKSKKFFGTPIASLDPETVQLNKKT